jgi:hypothetical protein
MKTTAETAAAITATRPRSTWRKGIKTYALEMLETLDTDQPPTLENLLNGARNWSEYSQGGCTLVYDEDIAARLAPPSQLAKKQGGMLPPNRAETWLDCQARALNHAARLIEKFIK